MKKLLIFLFVLIPVMVLGQTKKVDENIMVIADPHVMSQSLYDEGAAFVEMMNDQRKMIDLSEEAFIALIDTALLYKPALVLIPGDLTKDGEMVNHDLVVSQLKRLAEAGINSLVVAGNHDMNGKAYAYQGAEKISVDVLKDSDWEKKYAMVYDQAIAKDADSHSYVAEPIPGVTILGIDGAVNGVVGEKSLAWLLAQADIAREKGNLIIAMCHWQLLEHVDEGGVTMEMGRLEDADAVRDGLMAHGVHLVLTGHMHVNSISTFRDTVQMNGDSIVEISTGAPITFPCPYRWLKVASDRSSVEVKTDYLTALGEYTDLYAYSLEWMKEHTESVIPYLSVSLFDKSVAVMEELICAYPMGDMLFAALKSVLPQTNEEKVALVNKYLKTTIIELYLLHSIANESEHAEADSLANAMYSGIEKMIREATDIVLSTNKQLQDMLISTVVEANKASIQSLVEDRTHWASEYHSDKTDDLNVILMVNEAQDETSVEVLQENEVDMTMYDILGRQVRGEDYSGIYIQNGKKIIKK